MKPGWLLLALATVGISNPARAQSTVSACLPEALEPALRDALALELGVAIGPCVAEDSEVDTLRIAIEHVSPVTPLAIEVSSGSRRVSGRTAQPADVMGPRAIAVVVHGLVDELVAPAPIIQPPPSSIEEPTRAAPAGDAAESSAVVESASESSPEPPRPRRLILGVTVGGGLFYGWGDLIGASDPGEWRWFWGTLGVDARLHVSSGHGAALAARFAPTNDDPIIAVDLRYSYRLGFTPGLDVLGGAMFLEVGFGAIHTYYEPFRGSSRAFYRRIERVGLGPTLALVGVAHLGPVTLGLDVTYFATVNPWGTRDVAEETGHADRVTFASDFDIGVRVGSHLPL